MIPKPSTSIATDNTATSWPPGRHPTCSRLRSAPINLTGAKRVSGQGHCSGSAVRSTDAPHARQLHSERRYLRWRPAG
jgi:hypothetical protein